MQLHTKLLLGMAALICSFFLSLGAGLSTQALSLGDSEIIRTAVKPVEKLLSKDNSDTPPSQPAKTPPNNASSSPKNNSEVHQTSSQSPGAASVQNTTAPSQEVVHEPLPTVDTIDTSSWSHRLPQLAVERGFDRGSLPKALFTNTAAVPVMPIQASEDGWKVFGVAWYWWVLIGGLAGYSIRQLVLVGQRRMVARVPADD